MSTHEPLPGKLASLDSEALERHANRCMESGLLDEAEVCYREAMKSRPEGESGNLLFRLGMIYQKKGDPHSAERFYRRVIKIAPDFMPAHNNLGNVLKSVWRLTEAEQEYRRALELDASVAMVYNNLAGALSNQGRPDASLENYQHALRLEPHHPLANPNYLLAMHYGNQLSATEIWEAHQAWNERLAAPLTAAARQKWATKKNRSLLKVGFVSPDLRRHPVGIFLLNLVESIAHDGLHTVAYSTNRLEDDITGRLQNAFKEWRNIAHQDDEAAAAAIRRDGVDILVDLSGHTAGGRMLLFARKPAPIQITWLGYPDTTGLTSMDYRLTDEIADPPGTGSLYSEKLVRMPDGFLSFSPPDEAPEPVAPPILAAGGSVTFGSFNNSTKITPEILVVWAEILHRLPGARLILKNHGLQCPGLRKRLRRQFSMLGVENEQLELIPRVDSYQEHLALYNRLDIALDTFPYNGTTTTCEALWMGVPVVTLRGDRHCARVGASLLTRVALQQLIADNTQAYIDKAVALSADTERLAHCRKNLRNQMRTVPLGNPSLFARSFVEVLLDLAGK